MRDATGIAGLFVAGMALVAGIFSSSSSFRNEGPSLPEPDEPDEPEPRINLLAVACLLESNLARKGRRGTVVWFANGASFESPRPVDEYGSGWPTFRLSETSGRPRKVAVNPAQVVAVTKSIFRRTDRMTPDTVIETTGVNLVVMESVEEVMGRLG